MKTQDAGSGLRAPGSGPAGRSPLRCSALLLPTCRWLRPAQARRAKEDVNRQQVDGSTPLQWAVFNGDVAEVRRLLRAGAKVGQANNYGATPMSLAAEVANTEILKVLLEVGADVESPNADGHDGAAGGVAHGQRRSREAAAGPRRDRGCEARSGVGRRR